MGDKQENANIEHFNRRASKYETASIQGFLSERVQRLILKLAKDNQPNSVLDIGCGTRRLLGKAKEQWPNSRLTTVELQHQPWRLYRIILIIIGRKTITHKEHA